MKELWSKQYLDHISFITYLFGLFLGSFESPRVSAGIPVTIPIRGGVCVVPPLLFNIPSSIFFRGTYGMAKSVPLGKPEY
jgi:hypothetical protein